MLLNSMLFHLVKYHEDKITGFYMLMNDVKSLF